MPLGMTDALIHVLVFLMHWGRTLGTQGTCVCPFGGGSHCNWSVPMKLLLHPVASDGGSAELCARLLRQYTAAVQRAKEENRNM